MTELMGKKFSAKTIGIIILVLLVASAGAFWAGRTLTAPGTSVTTVVRTTTGMPSPEYGGTFTIAYDGTENTYGHGLDPLYHSGAALAAVTRSIFDSLLSLDLKMRPVPRLAESWKQIDDLTFEFYLRKGVKFHDGTPFNASAVKFTWDRSLNQTFPRNTIYTSIASIKSVEIVDNYTVRFLLNYRDADFFTAVAGHLGPVSPTAYMKYGYPNFGFHPVGCGPFKFVEWVSRDHVTVEANKDYWAGRPYVDRVIVRIVPEPSVRLLGVMKGEYELSSPSPDDVPGLMKGGKFNVTFGAPAKFYILSMFVDQEKGYKPLLDKRVRQAINYAINRKEILQAIDPYGEPAIGLCHPGFPQYYDEALRKYPAEGNVEKAKQLLAEAGYSGGFEVEIHTGSIMNFDKVATVIQRQLARVGIRVNIKLTDWAVEQNRLLGRDPPIQMAIHDLNVFYMSRFRDFFHSSNARPYGWNLQNVKNPQLDGLIERMMQEYDLPKRKAMVDEITKIILEEAYGAFLIYPSRIYATPSYIKNISVHPHQWFVYVPSIVGVEGLNVWIDQKAKTTWK